jgi:hypothetical protein
MTGKMMAIIGVVSVLGLILIGSAQAVALGIRYQAIPSLVNATDKAIAGERVQSQVVLPTPYPVDAKPTINPISSEAGRDYGLIVGAVILVLIVVGGVIFSARQKSSPKARD